MSEGVKYDGGKRRFSLLPWAQVSAIVDVLEFGARKYEVDNWQRVPNATERYANAAMRHVIARLEGERTDPESGLPHLAHACCCLLFWMWFDARDSEASRG